MFGQDALTPNALLEGPPLAPPPGTFDDAFLPSGLAAVVYIAPARDTWGAITVPTQATSAAATLTSTQPQAIGDPCLSVILDFLRAFVVNDQNATVGWKLVYPSLPPINKTFPHDPTQESFNTAALPAIYMWRDGSPKLEYAGEDWLRETCTVKALWVFPLALPDNQRVRSTFANALVKSIAVGIERGQTPSWVQPGDPDPNAATLGSVFGVFAGFESLSLVSHKPAKLEIPTASGDGSLLFPAIELTFAMEENLVYGTDRFAPLDPNEGTYLTLTNGTNVVAGPA